MNGKVVVMEKDAYQRWLAGPNAGLPPALQGAKLFQELNCVSCHRNGAGQRGPVLEGIFGKTVQLKGGGTVVADDNYIRESIVNPNAKTVEGFESLMPVYLSQLSEEQVNALLAYVRDTLGKEQPPMDGPSGTGATALPAATASPKASESKGR
jgi:cytochrome c oxidase subunit 2